MDADTRNFSNLKAGGALAMSFLGSGQGDLKLVDTVETGDHAVVVVEVTDVGLREEAPDVLTLKELSLNYGG